MKSSDSLDETWLVLNQDVELKLFCIDDDWGTSGKNKMWWLETEVREKHLQDFPRRCHAVSAF